MTNEDKKKLESRIRSHIGGLDAMTDLGEKHLDQDSYEEMCDYAAGVATKLRVILQIIKQKQE